MALVSAAFEIDGGTIAWTLLSDTYTLRSQDPIPMGDHTLRVAPGNPFDLAGLGVMDLFEQDFAVEQPPAVIAGAAEKDWALFDRVIFQLPDGNYVPATTVANRRTFHARPLDPETGLIYFRHRYFDPQLGRFITPDPMGYVDGPSMYQFAGNNPIDFRDPMGLHDSPWMLIREKDQLREAGFDDLQAVLRAAAQREREEEIALQATLLGSHLNAQGYEWSQDQSVLNDNAFWFFRGEGQTTQEAALWSGIVLGAQECDTSSVFCNVDWKSAAAVARTGDFVIGASLLVFDPFAAPGIADEFIRWADDLNSFRAARNVPRGTAATETVDLFRAVSPAEFDDIISFGFRPAPGGRSLAGKQFTLSLEEALKFADQVPDAAAIIRLRVPRSTFNQLEFSQSIDPFIFRSGVVTAQPGAQQQLLNQTLITVEHAF
jgi:RHS repeat-associated protein